MLSMKKNCSSIQSCLVVPVLIACLANNALATTMYPDVMGESVWFRNISENAKTPGDPEPLYGPPTASVNTLVFDPNIFDFSASSNDPLVDTTDGALSLMIEAKDGSALTSLSLEEGGFVNLFTLSGDPFAAVSGLIKITINEIDGLAVTPIKLPGVIPIFSPSGGDFQHSVDASSPLFSSAWTGTAEFDLAGQLVERGLNFDNGVTKITIALDNFLLAAAGEVGSLASIDKKDFSITVDTDGDPKVPEPIGLALAGLGLAFILANRKRSPYVAPEV